MFEAVHFLHKLPQEMSSAFSPRLRSSPHVLASQAWLSCMTSMEKEINSNSNLLPFLLFKSHITHIYTTWIFFGGVFCCKNIPIFSFPPKKKIIRPLPSYTQEHNVLTIAGPLQAIHQNHLGSFRRGKGAPGCDRNNKSQGPKVPRRPTLYAPEV